MYYDLATTLETMRRELNNKVPEQQVSSIFLFCKKAIEKLEEADSINDLMGMFNIKRDFNNSYELEIIPETLQEEINKIVEDDIDQNKNIHRVYGNIKASNIKKLTIKEVTIGEAMAAISSTVYPKLPEHFSIQDRKNVLHSLITEIIFNKDYIFITPNDKLLFNFEDTLYYTTISKTAFIPSSSKIEELLFYKDILDLITGTIPKDKKIISNSDYSFYYP